MEVTLGKQCKSIAAEISVLFQGESHGGEGGGGARGCGELSSRGAQALEGAPPDPGLQAETH